MLHVEHYEPFWYPPLARQTRTVGAAKIHVIVTPNGNVAEVTSVEGNQVLAKPAAENVKKMDLRTVRLHRPDRV
jgi:outer membrane biosynthesis protein TonB